ncbi:MAG TPA: DUF4136 domain-containing protein [Niabella sp.]|jgi:hypothetical protein|nr:DUF4136 domain-containing protein [Chitinophagaceae bacterium]HRN49545.1 DUF4136 domain-containing protein [Niabella sp.]HRO85805.1 DUF4136 domain-containing protein [Niabella sp.]HUN02526.1 DUF4136 domain-containing protein [Niabella sp.]
MKKLFTLLGLSAIIMIILTGCGPAAHIETSRNANFSQYRTFAWAQKNERSTRSDITEQRIKDAIGYQLAKTKGWREVRHNPDIILSYDVLVERSSRLQSDPVYSWGGFRTFYNPYARRFYNVYYPSRLMGFDNYSVPTKEGTITITMVDTKNDEAVLQAWATDEVDGRKLNGKEVDRIVNAIFKKWDNQMRVGNPYDEKYYSNR